MTVGGEEVRAAAVTVAAAAAASRALARALSTSAGSSVTARGRSLACQTNIRVADVNRR